MSRYLLIFGAVWLVTAVCVQLVGFGANVVGDAPWAFLQNLAPLFRAGSVFTWIFNSLLLLPGLAALYGGYRLQRKERLGYW